MDMNEEAIRAALADHVKIQTSIECSVRGCSSSFVDGRSVSEIAELAHDWNWKVSREGLPLCGEHDDV